MPRPLHAMKLVITYWTSVLGLFASKLSLWRPKRTSTFKKFATIAHLHFLDRSFTYSPCAVIYNDSQRINCLYTRVCLHTLMGVESNPIQSKNAIVQR